MSSVGKKFKTVYTVLDISFIALMHLNKKNSNSIHKNILYFLCLRLREETNVSLWKQTTSRSYSQTPIYLLMLANVQLVN